MAQSGFKYWSRALKPNSEITYIPPRYSVLKLTQAALGISVVNNDRNVISVKSVMPPGRTNAVICSLREGLMEQCALDLVFPEAVPVKFQLTGDSEVFLTGFIQPLEEYEPESSPSVDMQISGREAFSAPMDHPMNGSVASSFDNSSSNNENEKENERETETERENEKEKETENELSDGVPFSDLDTSNISDQLVEKPSEKNQMEDEQEAEDSDEEMPPAPTSPGEEASSEEAEEPPMPEVETPKRETKKEKRKRKQLENEKSPQTPSSAPKKRRKKKQKRAQQEQSPKSDTEKPVSTLPVATSNQDFTVPPFGEPEESSSSRSTTSSSSPSSSKSSTSSTSLSSSTSASSSSSQRQSSDSSEVTPDGSPKLRTPPTTPSTPATTAGATTVPSSKKRSNKKHKKWVKIPGFAGVKYKEKRVGEGKKLKYGKRVTVKYTGYRQDGNIFSSTGADGKPFSFKYGMSEVMKAWDVGLDGVRVGGKRRIQVPAKSAESSLLNIPAGQNLTFDIEVVSMK